MIIKLIVIYKIVMYFKNIIQKQKIEEENRRILEEKLNLQTKITNNLTEQTSLKLANEEYEIKVFYNIYIRIKKCIIKYKN